MKKRFSKEQIIGFLKEVDAGLPVKDLCRKRGFSEGSYYDWRSKFGGMSVPEAKRLKELESENTRLKKLLAETMLENEIVKEALKKSGSRTGKTGTGAVHGRQGAESASCFAGRPDESECVALQPAPDRNQALRERIVALAQRHRRYGAGMIYLKLRKEGLLVNHKRFDRLYAEVSL